MVQAIGNAETYVSAMHETAVPEVVTYHFREPKPPFNAAAALAAWDAVKPTDETSQAAALPAKKPCKNCGREVTNLVKGLCDECSDKVASYTPPEPAAAFEPVDLTPLIEEVDQAVTELAEVYERPTAPPPTVVEDVNVTLPVPSDAGEGNEERPQSATRRLPAETSPQPARRPPLEPAKGFRAAASSTTPLSSGVDQMLVEFARLGSQVIRDMRAAADRLDGLVAIMNRYLEPAEKLENVLPKPPRQSHVDTQAIADAYTSGKTVQEVAEETGHTRATVRRHLNQACVERRDDRKRNSGGHNRILEDSPIVVADIRRLYVDEGCSQVQVADRLGLTQRVVFGIMKRNGIEARSANAKPPPVSVAAQLHDRLEALGVSAANLRIWAIANNVPCPTRGPVPASVIDAWEAAQ